MRRITLSALLAALIVLVGSCGTPVAQLVAPYSVPPIRVPAPQIQIPPSGSSIGIALIYTPEPEPTLVPPTPTRLAESDQDLTISYADAADWLTDLPAEDREDQIRDWAVLGLAGLLNIDIETLRDDFYDQTPVRDSLFYGLTNARTSLGRGLPDGAGRLHVLVPDDDPYAARTIGLVLDDYIKDSGQDPAQVVLYRYQIDDKARQITLTPEPARPTTSIREQYGYKEMPVGSLADLNGFLAQTQHLSSLQIRDGQLWAGGWNWTGAPAGRVTASDLTVIQRGYENAAAGKSTYAGFSLDDGKSMTVSELIAILGARYPQLKARATEAAAFISAYAKAPTAQARQTLVDHLDDTLFELFNDDWRLQRLLLDTADGSSPSPYQVAHYYGGLGGTETGMTFFYTDLVAKAWTDEIGSGSPEGTVPGFVASRNVKSPWGLCTSGDEQGRQWFGLREENVSLQDNRVDFGSVAMRVFTLVNDSTSAEGREIEPSYAFGYTTHWWDRHYSWIADYEPQYHRLDQLMRWSAAIGWLVGQDKTLLPEVPDAEIKADWTFGDWLAAHPELKWRFDVPFVNPPGESTEALLKLYSESYEDCGQTWDYSGGVDPPSLKRLKDILGQKPKLNSSVARAGLTRDGTDFSTSTGSGVISGLNGGVKRQLDPVEGDATKIQVTANGNKVWSLGQSKIWINETALRKISLSLGSKLGSIILQLAVQDVPMGKLTVSAQPRVASVRFENGPLANARRALASLENALQDGGLDDVYKSVPAVSMSYLDPSGRVFLRLDGAGDSRWLVVEKGQLPSGQDLAFRLGAPVKGTGDIQFYTARWSDPPNQ